MKPVDQTTFGVPGGNCFSACVASLLELPIEEVPHFGSDDTWWATFQAWLKPRGLYAVLFKVDSDEQRPPGFHVVSGRSPRHDALHAVVGKGAEIAHDPHPSRDGLVSIEDVVLLVPFEPHRALL
jgi:hypothetical protein